MRRDQMLQIWESRCVYGVANESSKKGRVEIVERAVQRRKKREKERMKREPARCCGTKGRERVQSQGRRKRASKKRGGSSLFIAITAGRKDVGRGKSERNRFLAIPLSVLSVLCVFVHLFTSGHRPLFSVRACKLFLNTKKNSSTQSLVFLRVCSAHVPNLLLGSLLPPPF